MSANPEIFILEIAAGVALGMLAYLLILGLIEWFRQNQREILGFVLVCSVIAGIGLLMYLTMR